MSREIMRNTKREAVRAFLRRQSDFCIYGIRLRFQHAYGRYYQCLLPDGGEVFRMVAQRDGTVRVMEV